ncbi:hypothetical protein AAIH70_11450 [Neorhizobium sp. BT27B]|uniref:hypothetical protein n=1 Tax=Neorhizobium sp. BT27B TaxID=3142625 RepID=UPI003D2836D6
MRADIKGAASAAPASADSDLAAASISKVEATAQTFATPISKFGEHASDLPIAKPGGDPSLAVGNCVGFQDRDEFAGLCQKADWMTPAPQTPMAASKADRGGSDQPLDSMSRYEPALQGSQGVMVPPEHQVDGRPAIGVRRPSEDADAKSACDGASLTDRPSDHYISADVNKLGSTQSGKSLPQEASMDSYSFGRDFVERSRQSESDVFPQQDHRHTLDKEGQSGGVFDNAPSARGFLNSAVTHPVGISSHEAARNGELKGGPAPVSPGAGLRRNTVHGSREIESLDVASIPAPENHVAGVPEDLLKLTFAIQHNPNCPSQWLVRLPGKSGSIDMKPYRDLIGIVPHQTGDILGFGKTLDEAARAALAASEVKP